MTKNKTSKTSPYNMSFRLPGDLIDQYDYLKLVYPGGFTAWIVENLRRVEVNHELLERMREEGERLSKVSPIPVEIIDK